MPRTMALLLPVFCGLAITTKRCWGQSAENVSKVEDSIVFLKSNVRPAKNMSVPTEVLLSFHLMAITSLDTVQQRLISNGWFSVNWWNKYSTWNADDYGGVEDIIPLPTQMWRPRLSVINTLKDLKPIGQDYVVLNLRNDGLVSWYPAERFETSCPVDVTYFPFDVQKCRWELFGWSDDLKKMDLQLMHPSIDLDTFQANGEWELLNTSAWRAIRFLNKEPFSCIHYEVTLRRRPTLLALTVMLPVFVLAVVNVFVFTIPSEAGERLAYSMTALLSFGVFMSFILDSMPSSTKTLSIMAIDLSCLLVLSAIYVLLCILSLKLFHRDPHKHPVPKTLQTAVVWLELLTCLGPPSHIHKLADVDLTPVDVLAGPKADVIGSRLRSQLDKWARKRKAKHEAYSQPQDMTWKRVSRTLDKLLFRFFFCLVLASNTAVLVLIINNHYNY